MPVQSQEWKFLKERDGISIYTREEPGSKLKAFKGEAIIRTTLKEIYPILANPKHSDWWDDDVNHLEIIDFKKDEYSKYYLVYNVQWPFSDRDLYVESEISIDSLNSKAVISTFSVDGIIPEDPDLTRIKSYWQRWTAVEQEPGEVYLLLEGYTDPGGNIPAWLLNSFIGGTPMKLFENLKKKLE